MSYELNTTLVGNFDDAIEKVRAVLMEEQLGVVSEINVQGIFKAKLERDIPPYRIFGACNPKLAAEIIDAEPNAGTLLPCTFVMYAKDDNTVVVSFMDPETVLGLGHTEATQNVGRLAKQKLQRVIAKLSA